MAAKRNGEFHDDQNFKAPRRLRRRDHGDAGSDASSGGRHRRSGTCQGHAGRLSGRGKPLPFARRNGRYRQHFQRRSLLQRNQRAYLGNALLGAPKPPSRAGPGRCQSRYCIWRPITKWTFWATRRPAIPTKAIPTICASATSTPPSTGTAEGLEILAGQNWSLLTLNSHGITPRNEVPPATIDAQYAVGFNWARQPQLRIVKNWDHQFWAAVSVENPQTTFAPNAAAASGVTVTRRLAGGSLLNKNNNYSLNHIPDVIGKVAWEPMIGGAQPLHMEAFGIYRDFYDRVNIAATNGARRCRPASTMSTSPAAASAAASPGRRSPRCWTCRPRP